MRVCTKLLPVLLRAAAVPLCETDTRRTQSEGRGSPRRGAPRAAARRGRVPRLARGGELGGRREAGESDWDGERACARGETERDGVVYHIPALAMNIHITPIT